MKFNRLQASISNNADQSPSLYMALCAIESLFADLEESYGSDINLCPVGDERLPSKLVWLCRVINEIYRDNSDELQRNRSRLDMAMEKLKETQKELEKSAAVCEELAKLNSEYAVLQQKLESNGAAAAEYEKISAKCRQAKQTLEQLGTFDFVAAENELKQLTADIALKEGEKSALLTKLNQTRECADELEQEVDELKTKEQDLRNQLSALQGKKSSIGEGNESLLDEIDRLTTKLASSQDELSDLVAKRDDIQNNILILQGKIAEFRDESLTAKHAELEAVKEEAEQLEDELNAFEQDCCKIKDKRNQLLIDIAHKKAENESLNEKFADTQQKRDNLEKEKLCLSATLSDSVQKLESLQTEVDELNQKKLPEVWELQTQEQCRKTELEQKVTEAENQLIVLQEEIAKLNDRLPKLEEEVENNRVVYKALAASCAVSSGELESLEKQIEELRNNTDEQKLVVYRKQLEEKQQELENIQLECERMKQETADQGIKLEQLQEERARLRDLKNRHEQGVMVTEKQLRELETVVNEEYIHEVISAEERIKLLENVRSKLSASITNMQKILGKAPVQEPISLEDQLKFELRELRIRTDDLRCSLVECAHSLKLEER